MVPYIAQIGAWKEHRKDKDNSYPLPNIRLMVRYRFQLALVPCKAETAVWKEWGMCSRGRLIFGCAVTLRPNGALYSMKSAVEIGNRQLHLYSIQKLEQTMKWPLAAL